MQRLDRPWRWADHRDESGKGDAATWCVHPGHCMEKGKGPVQVYLYQEVTERKHKEMISHASAHTAESDIYGMKGPTFMLIPYFNVVSGCIVDYMHCIDLGVMRQLTTLRFDRIYHKELWYIGTRINNIDSKFTIKNITRLPRSVVLKVVPAGKFVPAKLGYSVPAAVLKLWVVNTFLAGRSVGK
ncbi:UNVERIFIED_CONTAM: hypothetical protein FKN15_054695 [Acipenser sinensis]